MNETISPAIEVSFTLSDYKGVDITNIGNLFATVVLHEGYSQTAVDGGLTGATTVSPDWTRTSNGVVHFTFDAVATNYPMAGAYYIQVAVYYISNDGGYYNLVEGNVTALDIF